MAEESLFQRSIVKCFLSKVPFIRPKIESLQRSASNSKGKQFKVHKYTSLDFIQEELSNHTLVCHLESALLKSSSMFPYFILVAFEAGSIFRAFILLLLHPLVCLVGEEMRLKIMVFLCFVGVRKEKFRVGKAVLPRHFLQDVGNEGYNILEKSWGKKIALSDLPNVMIEGLSKDYLGIETVVGKELKEIGGYYVGLIEDQKTDSSLNAVLRETEQGSHIIGFGCYTKFLDHKLLRNCKVVYQVTNTEKEKWQPLPRRRYPKPLIFHDGRLAFRPTPLATLALFMWIPLGIFLCIIRIISGLFLPEYICSPILAFTGVRSIFSVPKSLLIPNDKQQKPKGTLYICNHKTLLDPVYVQYALRNPLLSTVTYSLSTFNEMISPIKNVRLTRDYEADRKIIDGLLSEGDLVICPEGTTCREPYLLRFSPLFAEVSEEIVPVAIDAKASMFYGSTANGFKCLDPAFHFLNPFPTYYVKILDKLPTWCTHKDGKKSRFEVANYVQNEISKTLGYECTRFTRKDKYMILAGNSGVVQGHLGTALKVEKELLPGILGSPCFK